MTRVLELPWLVPSARRPDCSAGALASHSLRARLLTVGAVAAAADALSRTRSRRERVRVSRPPEPDDVYWENLELPELSLIHI